MQRYCDEFAARYNTRKIADDERFDIALGKCDGRLKYNDLTNTEYIISDKTQDDDNKGSI